MRPWWWTVSMYFYAGLAGAGFSQVFSPVGSDMHRWVCGVVAMISLFVAWRMSANHPPPASHRLFTALRDTLTALQQYYGASSKNQYTEHVICEAWDALREYDRANRKVGDNG